MHEILIQKFRNSSLEYGTASGSVPAGQEACNAGILAGASAPTPATDKGTAQ